MKVKAMLPSVKQKICLESCHEHATNPKFETGRKAPQKTRPQRILQERWPPRFPQGPQVSPRPQRTLRAP